MSSNYKKIQSILDQVNYYIKIHASDTPEGRLFVITNTWDKNKLDIVYNQSKNTLGDDVCPKEMLKTLVVYKLKQYCDIYKYPFFHVKFVENGKEIDLSQFLLQGNSLYNKFYDLMYSESLDKNFVCDLNSKEVEFCQSLVDIIYDKRISIDLSKKI